MKSIKCDVIKDLLPSYSDRMLSDTSNQLVEEHLKQCESCSDILKNMNKEIDTETLFNQEEIDYLKKYRKEKMKIVVLAIVLSIFFILESFMIIQYYISNSRHLICADEVMVESWIQEDIVGFYFTDKKYNIIYDMKVVGDENNQSICVKILGVYNIGEAPTSSIFSVKIEDTLNNIYIEDKNGNFKEIWNKDTGILVKDISTRVNSELAEHHWTINEITEYNRRVK